jgi:adenosine deaminase
MRKRRLSTTFCTDNRTVSNTTVTREIELAMKHLELTPGELKRSVIYGFKRSFFPGTYLEKRRYVRKVIDYYELLESIHPELRPSPPVASREVSLAPKSPGGPSEVLTGGNTDALLHPASG